MQLVDLVLQKALSCKFNHVWYHLEHINYPTQVYFPMYKMGQIMVQDFMVFSK